MTALSSFLLRRHSCSFRYGSAAVVGVAAVLSTYAAEAYLQSSMYFIGVGGVALVSVLAGIGPACATLLVITCGLTYHVFPQPWSLQIESGADVVRLALFVVLSIGVALLGAMARNGVERERELSENLCKERELREKYVNTLAHDLRAPLSAAKLSIDTLARHQNIEPERRDRLRKGVVSSIERMDRMIQDLLDANSMRAGAPFPITIERVNLDEFLKCVIEQLELQYGRRFRLHLDGDLDGCWCPGALRRILENLVSNAVKYGDEKTEITISARNIGERVVLSVHNHGNPIPPDDRHCLFQSFGRSKSALHSAKTGWGLGLTLVRGLAEAHGGGVQVESDQKHGTTFTVRLPLDSGAAQEKIKDGERVS